MQRELLARVNDGWDVVERDTQSMTLTHIVPPPWWRILIELPFRVLLSSGSTTTDVRRTLTVSFDDEGRLQRSTTGEIPRSWQRPFSWEVPDGPAD